MKLDYDSQTSSSLIEFELFWKELAKKQNNKLFIC